MKNKFAFFLVISILLVLILGCRFYDPLGSSTETPSGNANSARTGDKSLSDKAIDTAVGGEKIGVQECDELYEYVGDLVTKGEDENFATKAARQYFLNRIREQIKTSIEQNKNDKAQMAKDCKDYRRQIDAFINQPPDNSK